MVHSKALLGRYRSRPTGPGPVKVTAFARGSRRFGALLALPATVIILALVGAPGIRAVLYSFQTVSLDGATKWAGLSNYSILFGDSAFLQSAALTAEYAVCFLVLSTILGLSFALLLNQEFHGRWLCRALLIVPWACPWVIVGTIWKWLTDGSVGALNALLVQSGLTHHYTSFLASQSWAVVFTILAGVWRQASFSGLLFLAALQTIPGELYEAAQVDGASPWQRLRRITLPWLREVGVVVVVVNTIFGIMMFDVVYAMTQGGPGQATSLLSIFLYNELYSYDNVGLASATAVLLGLAALGLGVVFVRMLYRASPLRGESA